MSFITDIDFKNGVIIKNDLDKAYIESLKKSTDYNVFLKEDLLQIEFISQGESKIVDVGWYENLELNHGGFRVFVVFNHDWENLIYSEFVPSFDELKEKILFAIEKAKK
jgi:hypothetical protein